MLTPASVAVAGYRLNHFLARRGLGPLAKVGKYVVIWLCGIEIDYRAQIGRGFRIHHGYGAIVSGTIGENVHVNQGVTVGGNWGKRLDGRSLPLIGDNVWIMAGAKVLGPVQIGSNVLIGANSVVLDDIPENSVVAGVPARVLRSITIEDMQRMSPR